MARREVDIGEIDIRPCFVHFQWSQNFVLDEVAPGSSWRCCLLPSVAEDCEAEVGVGREEAPGRARELHFGDGAEILFLVFGSAHDANAKLSGEAGEMAHELAEGDVVLAIGVYDGERRQELLDGVIEREAPSLAKH